MPRDRAGLARFLSRTPFFGGLDDIALRHVVAMTNERIFPRGTAVFREGEQGRSMYVVESGELVALKSGDSGRAVRLMHLKPGDFFGETTLIEMQPRPFSVVVEHETRLLELTNADLYKLYQEPRAVPPAAQGLGPHHRLRRRGRRRGHADPRHPARAAASQAASSLSASVTSAL